MLKASKSIYKLGMAVIAFAAMTSCDDDTSPIGTSLLGESSEVKIFDNFTVTGKTVENPWVQTRNVTQVLGSVTAEGYGTFSSDFVTEFLPASRINTYGITIDQVDELVDSLVIHFYIPKGSTVGDTIVPMGLKIYELKDKLKSDINSTLNISTEGLNLLAERMYVCNSLGETDSIKALSYTPLDIKINDNGRLARKLFSLYLTNSGAFQIPSEFTSKFHGIYVTNSFGSGRVMGITSTVMSLHYHTIGTNEDGKPVINKHEGTYFAVTPEVLTNNMVRYKSDQKLDGMIAAGDNILVAPIGRDIEMIFPVKDIIEEYQKNAGSLSVINGLSLDLPAEAIENSYGIEPPSDILMILSKDKDKFFKNSELTDDVTSFYATYDSTNKRYRFAGLRTYLLKMLEKEANGTLAADDYTFTLSPVSVVTESNTSNSYYGTATTYLSAINPYIGTPVMVKLNLSGASINFTFSKQKIQ